MSVDTNDSYVQVIEQDLLRIGGICAAWQTLNISGVNHNVMTDKRHPQIVATASIKGP